MKHFYVWLLWLLAFLPGSAWALRAEELTDDFYRIRVKTQPFYAINALDNGEQAVKMQRGKTPFILQEVWQLKRLNNAWVITSVHQGKSVANMKETNKAHRFSNGDPGLFYIKDHTDQQHVIISNVADFSGSSCWHRDGSNRIVVHTENYDDSRWILEKLDDAKVQDSLTAEKRAQLAAAEARIELYRRKLNAYPQAGKSYRLLNRLYPNKALTFTFTMTSEAVAGRDKNVKDYAQVFHITHSADGNSCALQNLVTQKYVANNAGRSAAYGTKLTADFFRMGSLASENVIYNTFDGLHTGFHMNSSYSLVGWQSDAQASQWVLEEVQVDSTELNKQRKLYQDLQTAYPQDGKAYRLVNRQYNTLALTVNLIADNYAGVTKASTDYSQVFRVYRKANTNEYALQNVVNDKYVGLNYVATETEAYFRFGALLANDTIFSTFDGTNGLHLNASKKLVGWTSQANASQWVLEEVNIDEAELQRQRTSNQANLDLFPQEDKNYRLVNRQYGKRLTAKLTTDDFGGSDLVENDYTQVFRFRRNGNTNNYSLNNLVNQKYIGRIAGFGAKYLAKPTEEFFQVAFNKVGDKIYYTFTGATTGMHQDGSANIVAWNNESEASQWTLEEVVDIDSTALNKQRTDYESFAAVKGSAQELQANKAQITEKLNKYFDDYACTLLKSEYQSQTPEQLRAAMQADALPSLVQEMALRVQANKWNTRNERADSLERRFRINLFQAHSDNVKWRAKDLAATAFVFSQLTNPTGITIAPATAVQIYVDSDVPSTCTLQAEVVTGFSATGVQTNLTKGFNNIFVNDGGHLYIRYNINDTQVLLKDVPDVKIHIEGGRVNGYYDRYKDNHGTWEAMKSLTSEGYMQDEVWRMKSQCFAFVVHKEDMLNAESRGEWNYQGEKKSLSEVLANMDTVNMLEREFTDVLQFKDRFNCLHLYSSASALYASSYGVYMGRNGVSYRQYISLGENNEGGNLWALAHEVGHHYQDVFDIQGCLESSNNLMSTVANWKLGGTVSRGGPMKNYFDYFQSDTPWSDRTIAAKIRMFYQLWQYYDLLGNHKDFYKKLSNLFRKNPIVKGHANTDYLYFARTVADLVQEDLTDFFTFHGFFSKKNLGRVRMVYGDSFYDGPGGYKPVFNEINEADIDATLEYMKKYPKKGVQNLMFIDDRIKPSIDERTGMPRTSASGIATIGDAAEVGNVGMYTDFTAQSTASPSEVLLEGRNVYIREKGGSVGYKVYDNTGKLVFLSNSNDFVLPTNIDPSTVTIKVAGGNGDDVEIVTAGQVVEQYNAYERRNFTGLQVSTNVDNPEHQYHICHGVNIQNWLGNNLGKTEQATRASFALFPGIADNTFYILNVNTKQWLSYNDINAGANKVVWESIDNKAAAKVWKIELDEKGRGFDLFPLNAAGQTNGQAWNWFGGARSDNPIGLYGYADNGSSWQFIPKNPVYNIEFSEGQNGNYASIYLPFAITLPEGVTAHTGTEQGTYVDLESVNVSGVLPQHTAAILKSNKPGVISFTAAPTTHTSISTVWTGAHARVKNESLNKAAYDYYALKLRSDATFVLGLVGKANIPATRAYLRVPKSNGTPVQELQLNFQPIITAVNEIESNTSTSGKAYDLGGRRKVNNHRGVFIKNGQKHVTR